MELNYAKEWFERRIETDGDVEIGAGLSPAYETAKGLADPATRALDTRLAFGQFIEFWRRNQGWNAEKLATEAGIDLEEVFEIEHNPFRDPEPDAVRKLATVFGVPARTLLELAGSVGGQTPGLRQAAIRFAARSEPVSVLSEVERQAFEVFVAALTSEPETPVDEERR